MDVESGGHVEDGNGGEHVEVDGTEDSSGGSSGGEDDILKTRKGFR